MHPCIAGCTWGACAAPEICRNSVDDDCDRLTDEGCDGGVISCVNDAPCAASGLVCNENWGICVVAGCAGRPDFTPCETVTSPDRAYDICLRNACVSPGCGDATCNPPRPDWPLPDTNMRACFDLSGPVACPGSPGSAACGSTPFCGQDAQYGWDLTHSEADRFTRTEPIAGEPIVVDNITALVWQGCSAGQTGLGCVGSATAFTWADALAYCDSLSWAGLTDWRLPDRYEMQALLDYGATIPPASYWTAFPRTYSYPYWTSTTYASTTAEACYASGEFGGTHHSPKTNANYVRCVRRGPVPEPATRFTRTEPAPDQPVVADVVSGLVWQGCVAGLSGSACTLGGVTTLDWQAALAYCENLVWGGRDDWYLPNCIETNSIIDDGRSAPAIDPTAFPAMPDYRLWTSSPYVRPTTPWQGWVLSSSDSVVYTRVATNPYDVLCVRRGP
jgi:hypothetical protein